MLGIIPHISFKEMLTGTPKKALVYSIRVGVKRKDEKCELFWASKTEDSLPTSIPVLRKDLVEICFSDRNLLSVANLG
jgi:hypothetical protein